LSASESAAAPASPISLKLTSSDVSVALLFSASESAAAPAPPMAPAWGHLLDRL
jgi:hypothetical protein